MQDAINSTFELIVLSILFIVDAIETLLSSFTPGCLKKLPEKKSKTELTKMLKKDLIDLVITYQT